MDAAGQAVEDRHEDGHHPAGPGEPLFQESWALTWVDPVNRLAGWHHFGLQRVRGVADINSYLSHNGRVVGRHEDLEHPLPEGDFPNLRFPSIEIAAIERLTTHSVTIRHGAATADLTMRAFVGPLDWKHQEAPSHWESFGKVTGIMDIGGERLAVNALAFQDRSWGSRDLRDMIACRVITAIFGDDLIFRLFEVKTGGRTSQYGYVLDGGRRNAIVAAELKLGMASDGLNLESLTSAVWTEGGRGYSLTGLSLDQEIGANRDERVSIQGNFIFRNGGRIGTGFVVDLRKMTDEHAAACAARAQELPGKPGQSSSTLEVNR